MIDDEPTGTRTVDDGQMAEGGDRGAITLTRTGSTASALSIVLDTTGSTAHFEDDYIYGPGGSFVIPAGSASRTILIFPVDDNLAEDTEILKVAVAAGFP